MNEELKPWEKRQQTQADLKPWEKRQQGLSGDNPSPAPTGYSLNQLKADLGHTAEEIPAMVLPTLGAIGGGALGSSVAGPVGTVAGSMAGAALGRGANEFAKRTGTVLDEALAKPGSTLENLRDAPWQSILAKSAKEGAAGGEADLLGQAMNAGFPPAIKLAGKAASGMASMLTGAETPSFQFILDHPELFNKAIKNTGQFLEDTASKIKSHLEDVNQTKINSNSEALQNFVKTHGSQIEDTTPLIQSRNQFIENNKPTPRGIGKFTPAEIEMLQSEGNNSYTTENPFLTPIKPKMVNSPFYGPEIKGYEPSGPILTKSAPENTVEELVKARQMLDSNINYNKSPNSRYIPNAESQYKTERNILKNKFAERDPGLAASNQDLNQWLEQDRPYLTDFLMKRKGANAAERAVQRNESRLPTAKAALENNLTSDQLKDISALNAAQDLGGSDSMRDIFSRVGTPIAKGAAVGALGTYAFHSPMAPFVAAGLGAATSKDLARMAFQAGSPSYNAALQFFKSPAATKALAQGINPWSLINGENQ